MLLWEPAVKYAAEVERIPADKQITGAVELNEAQIRCRHIIICDPGYPPFVTVHTLTEVNNHGRS